MGMDVYGNEPTAENGGYFRANVWYWHPLWEYCEKTFPDLAGKVEHGHSNSGDGLNAEDSLALSKLISESLTNGVAEKHAAERNAYLSELPRPECELCNGTGIREDEIGIQNGMPDKELDREVAIVLGRSHGWCNGCSGEGNNDAWETNYRFDLEVLAEFADFLKSCGGFKIC